MLARIIGAAPRLLAAAATLLLAGCLVSKEPLVTAENAVWPLAAGTVLEEYEVANGRLVPSGENGKPTRGTLLIENGYYVWHTAEGEPEKTAFRVHALGRDGLHVVMFALDEHDEKDSDFPVFYGLLKAERGQFLLWNFTGEHFERYAAHKEKTAPRRWKGTEGKDWRRTGGGSDVEIASLAFLAEILPEMAALGFHAEEVWAYRPAKAP